MMNKLKEKTIEMTTTLLASTDNKNTYAYSKELTGITGKHGIFILLYPTRDEDNFHVEDMTNVHIINHMMELNLASYTVVNLFSQVTKSRLSTRGLTVDEENISFIEKEIFGKMSREDTIVIVAWGNSHQTSRAVNQSKLRILEYWMKQFPNEQLYQLSCNGMDENSYGIHPLFMGIRYNNAAWELVPYPVKKTLKSLLRVEAEKEENTKNKRNVPNVSSTEEAGTAAGVVESKGDEGKAKQKRSRRM